ncbi:MAG TPA: 2-hydroxyacyl-CoA dehydratase family protein [Deltaproteobacteria bacterium]|nr:2-hydroxyacyl-CoA dehydratase family protein [Deltaproteobacteria bacterium]HOM28390.1 2-hydroxyacyl-CoA dehydratase family protein [Deltaproteobacteria bacterium]HPP80274.1 2-hydroxyacyl-CoA dehydratase family protein [Deltaproteobacteria bacterium]
MIETLRKAARSIGNPSLQAWNEGGGKVLGYPCTFVPEEIIDAAGILPYRLRGITAGTMSIGDAYFGPVICSFPKCILQLAGQGSYGFLDGAVVVNGCDSMRRLHECWRKASEDIPGTLPGFFHYMGVPHKATDYSIEWFKEELGILARSISDHFGTPVTTDSLRRSIRLFNEIRSLLSELDEMRMSETCPVTGSDAASIVLAGFAMPREEYRETLGKVMARLRKSKPVSDGKVRLMVVGSASDDADFVELVESTGAIVVSDCMCFGARSFLKRVDEDADPIEALAERYLGGNLCPRMFGWYKDRLAFVRDRALRSRVDGVILQNIRFCDLHGSENGLLERDLEAEGIPCMRIEREYGPLVETGRIKMRLDAFMERIRTVGGRRS